MIKYETAAEWQQVAMQRMQGVSRDEQDKRREQAQKHIQAEGIQPNADLWADYELYILGKMELEEYQDYLLFKYSVPEHNEKPLSEKKDG